MEELKKAADKISILEHFRERNREARSGERLIVLIQYKRNIEQHRRDSEFPPQNSNGNR